MIIRILGVTKEDKAANLALVFTLSIIAILSITLLTIMP